MDKMTKRVIIDTDPGVDDAMAIILALRSPELEVEAITTVNGNTGLKQCTENTLRLLDILNLPNPPPVARGAERPLCREPFASVSIHGRDGLGGISLMKDRRGKKKYPGARMSAVPEHAVDLICELTTRYPGEITLVTLGPLTNIALAMKRDPKVARKIKEIVTMGGAYSVCGNVTPAAEFNFFCDPEAAQAVIKAEVPITLVGLDVTLNARLSRSALLDATQKRTKLNRFLRDATGHVMDFYLERQGYHGCCVHDALAMMVAIDKNFVGLRRAHVDIETEGKLTAGMSVTDLRPYARGQVGNPNADIALFVDSGRFESFLLERITDG